MKQRWLLICPPVLLLLLAPAGARPTDGNPPINLAVSGITIDDQAAPAPPGERHGPPPSSVLARWAEQRLHAVGGGAPARFTVLEASVVVEQLPVEGGFQGMFKDQQDRRLVARLRARLDYSGARSIASAIAEGTASTTLPESASLADVDAAYAKVLDLAADGFDRKMSDEIRARFGSLVVR